jgi:hypothetical protein
VLLLPNMLQDLLSLCYLGLALMCFRYHCLTYDLNHMWWHNSQNGPLINIEKLLFWGADRNRGAKKHFVMHNQFQRCLLMIINELSPFALLKDDILGETCAILKRPPRDHRNMWLFALRNLLLTTHVLF